MSLGVPASAHVTQVLDIRGTQQQLTEQSQTGERLRARIATAIAREAAGTEQLAVFSCKNLNPSASGSGPKLMIDHPSVRYGHYGKDERALNTYQDADLVAIVGRHTPPIDHLRAELQAVRFAVDPPSKTGPSERLLPYGWRGPDGAGMGRRVPSDPDPDVDAYIRWSAAATVHQTIGRGRPVLRSPGSPLRVLLITNEPIVGLYIDRLVSLEDLGAPRVKRQAPTAFLTRRDARNATVQADQRQKVEVAITALVADGQRITKKTVAELAGIHRTTLYNNPLLRSLVEAAITASSRATSVEASDHTRNLLSEQDATDLPRANGNQPVG